MVATDSPCDEIKPGREPLAPERVARRAALIEALRDAVPIEDGPDAMQFWSLGTYFSFKPQTAWEDWLSQHVAITMIKINRAERIERKLRDLQSLRAIDCWETDRRLKAEQVAIHLVRHPNQTYGKLLDTLGGCEWLIARWEELAPIPSAQWTEAQRTLASLIQPGGGDKALAEGFAERLLALLRDHRDRLLPADEALRNLVANGLNSEASPALAQQRRETRALYRHLKWLVAQLRVPMPKREVNPYFRPIYDQPSEPATTQETAVISPTVAAAVTPDDRANPFVTPPADSATTPADRANPFVTPPADGAPVLNETEPTEASKPQPASRTRFADLTDAEKAARVAERKRRPDPERAAAQLRRTQRRSA